MSYCSEYFWAASMFDPRPPLASNKSPGFGRSMDYDLGYWMTTLAGLNPLVNSSGPKVLRMSSYNVIHQSGTNPHWSAGAGGFESSCSEIKLRQCSPLLRAGAESGHRPGSNCSGWRLFRLASSPLETARKHFPPLYI